MWHVRDDPVRDDEEYKVLRSVPGRGLGDVGHVVDAGREVGGAEQLDALEAGFVRGENACKKERRKIRKKRIKNSFGQKNINGYLSKQWRYIGLVQKILVF